MGMGLCASFSNSRGECSWVNAKSIEEIKSFLSRQKEVYKIPYETHPADRPRQCVFGGTSNALDFLPLDRSGNRRFIPVMVYPEQAEVHILEDEAASRAYIEQMWAEAMEIYRSGRFKLAFSPAMQRYLKEHQRDFMPEDTKAGMIQAYLCLLYTSKERTHRLCTRGGMLESFLQEPERLTDDDVMLLLKLIFHRQDTQDILKKLLEREKPETP